MTRIAPSLLLILCCLTQASADVEFQVLARGDDGQAEAKLEKLDSPERRAVYGMEAVEGRRLVAIHLGEQPQGTTVEVQRAFATDNYGLGLKVRLTAQAPAVAKQTVRPYLIVSLPRAWSVEHSVRMTLRLGEAVLGPMSLEAADRTRAKLAPLKRSQRRKVKALSLQNAAQRARVGRLEREILAYQDDSGYEAAVNALSFEPRIHRVIEEASFRTDLKLFGTTLNPFWTSGDENLKYLPAATKRSQRARQTAEIEQGYAEEAERIEQKLVELQGMLTEMQEFAAAHAASIGAAGVIAGKSR